MAHWLEHSSLYRRVASSILSEGTYLGCGFDPWLQCAWEVTHQCFSHNVSLSLSLSLSLLPPHPSPPLAVLLPLSSSFSFFSL